MSLRISQNFRSVLTNPFSLGAERVLGSASFGGYGRQTRLDVSAAHYYTHLWGGLRQTPSTLPVLVNGVCQQSFREKKDVRRRRTSFFPRFFSGGFTLIEVLVAVALISTIMVLIWQTMGASMKAKSRIEKRDEIYHNVRVSVDKMVQDLSMAFLLSGTAQLGQRQGSPQLKTIFKGDADQILFATLAHLRLYANARESASANVTYKLERDPNDNELYLLKRKESKWLSTNPEEGGVWITLAEKVKGMKIDYYDARKYDWQSSWNTESDTGLRLPRAVRVALTFKNPDNADEDIHMTTIALVGMNNAIDF